MELLNKERLGIIFLCILYSLIFIIIMYRIIYPSLILMVLFYIAIYPTLILTFLLSNYFSIEHKIRDNVDLKKYKGEGSESNPIIIDDLSDFLDYNESKFESNKFLIVENIDFENTVINLGLFRNIIIRNCKGYNLSIQSCSKVEFLNCSFESDLIMKRIYEFKISNCKIDTLYLFNCFKGNLKECVISNLIVKNSKDNTFKKVMLTNGNLRQIISDNSYHNDSGLDLYEGIVILIFMTIIVFLVSLIDNGSYFFTNLLILVAICFSRSSLKQKQIGIKVKAREVIGFNKKDFLNNPPNRIIE